MLIVDSIEKVDSVFDQNFKDKELQKFSSLKGETIPLFHKKNLQISALITNNRFYLSTIEELQGDSIKVQVFEFNTVDLLVSKTQKLLGWSGKEKFLKNLFQSFKNMIN